MKKIIFAILLMPFIAQAGTLNRDSTDKAIDYAVCRFTDCYLYFHGKHNAYKLFRDQCNCQAFPKADSVIKFIERKEFQWKVNNISELRGIIADLNAVRQHPVGDSQYFVKMFGQTITYLKGRYPNLHRFNTRHLRHKYYKETLNDIVKVAGSISYSPPPSVQHAPVSKTESSIKSEYVVAYVFIAIIAAFLIISILKRLKEQFGMLRYRARAKPTIDNYGNNDKSTASSPINLTEEDVSTLKKAHIDRKSNIIPDKQKETENKNKYNLPTPSYMVKYASIPVNGGFYDEHLSNHFRPHASIYRIRIKNEEPGVAYYTIEKHRSAYDLAMQFPDVNIYSVCTSVNTVADARNGIIENIRHGLLHFNEEDGKWDVAETALIEFK